ncbi:HDOD domain-containing protein [Pseudomonas panipatensis]|uniref:HD-like signal output (HDOD) domain, no enzymatic activity n=1 Tax=Pseudomonas panipatensis TaxID=428992 RepID=A0A1G8H7A0_9PSED|nr:HDOD domain-containing protein [Pseudomonas panipatensis]SDI02485.1 HD-like signal output (HDOD) domain, no enzymatic activity [Pseudomonas panipatensis]SMP57012.1 HD-like signal output (HDOD) domain, no enzymatic activity [Pseudomonas panipatensis]
MPLQIPDKDRLASWLQLLENLPLPVPAEQHERIRRALADNRRSLRDIAELLQDCPTLALAILREANRAASARDNPAESLEVALSRLGLSRASALLERLPSVKQADMPPALGQMLLISRHAMQQASGLFAGRLARLWQEIHWGSLFTLAPLWALATARPDLLEQWQQQVFGQGRASAEVEEALLGMRLLPLCLALAERWRLPEWIGQGLRLLSEDRELLVRALHLAHAESQPLAQQQRLDADPELARWLTRPANTILLANSLAMAAHQSWSGPHMLRWQRLTALYLQMPLEDLQQQVHGLAAQSARRDADPRYWHPAQALLWPWDSRRWLPRAEKPAQPMGSPDQWRRHCAELLRSPSPFSNLLQLLDCAAEALQACGYGRGALLLADRQQSLLQARRGFGLAQPAEALQLSVANSQLLRKLLQRPARLQLNPGNIADYSAVLPGRLKSALPSEHLMLRSLSRGTKVVMLVVADRQGQAISEVQAQAFDKTCQCIERGIQQFAGGQG